MCSPRASRPGTGRRGSHRPVPATLDGCARDSYRPSGPSFQVGTSGFGPGFRLDAAWGPPYNLGRPVTPEDQAVYFNAVPLFILAGAYLMVTAALAPTLWRERHRVTVTDLGLAAIFPAIGIAAAIFAIEVLHDRAPIGGHVWPALVATLVALVPALIFLRRWSEPAGVVMSGARAREAEELVGVRDRELDAVARIINALARIQEPVDAARVLLDEVEGLIGADFNALALVHQDEDEAVGLLARSAGEDLGWWSDVRVHLHNEPSGIASAFFEAAPVVVYDVESSPLVSQRLAKTAGAKSAAFVPLIV